MEPGFFLLFLIIGGVFLYIVYQLYLRISEYIFAPMRKSAAFRDLIEKDGFKKLDKDTPENNSFKIKLDTGFKKFGLESTSEVWKIDETDIKELVFTQETYPYYISDIVVKWRGTHIFGSTGRKHSPQNSARFTLHNISGDNIKDYEALTETIMDPNFPYGQHIFKLLDNKVQDIIEKHQPGDSIPGSDKTKIAEGLNELIEKSSFYNPNVFGELMLNKEFLTLYKYTIGKNGKIEKKDLRRLNRLLLEMIFPDIIKEHSWYSKINTRHTCIFIEAELDLPGKINIRKRRAGSEYILNEIGTSNGVDLPGEFSKNYIVLSDRETADLVLVPELVELVEKQNYKFPFSDRIKNELPGPVNRDVLISKEGIILVGNPGASRYDIAEMLEFGKKLLSMLEPLTEGN